MNKKFVFTTFVLISMLLNLAAGIVPTMNAAAAPLAQDTPPPTITSDKGDYLPGSTVILTGAGFLAGEAVHIFVNDDASNTWKLDSGIDGAPADPTADETGSFTYSFQLPNWFVASYIAKATGQASTLSASVTFADNDTYDWSQCKNDVGGGSPLSGGFVNDNKMDYCQWVNGNLGSSNSIYTEGDVVPQRAIRTVATVGDHSITFDHSFYQTSGGAYTYDFLATADSTLKSLLAACNDVPTTGNFAGLDNAGCLNLLQNKTVLPLPDESTWTIGGNTYVQPHLADAVANAAPDGVTRDLWYSCGYFTTVGKNTVLNVGGCSNVTPTILGHGASNGTLLSSANQVAPLVDSYTQMRVSFSTTQPNALILIWFGGHLAKGSFWSTLTDTYKAPGAASASGSSFHERLIADEAGSIGNRDNQLQSGVVVPPGSLTIVKDDISNSSTPFSFTANAPLSPSNFTLCDPAVTGCPSSQTFASLPTGSYTVNETVPSNWTLSNLVCTGGTSSFSYTSTGVTVTLQPGDNVTCTFTDTHVVNSPTITTTLSQTTASVGASVHDSATLSGATSNAGGTVTYTVYSDNACTNSIASAGTKTVTNGTVPDSDPVTFNTAGTYYWQAVYSGDANNSGATSACQSEVLTVGKLNSTTLTEIHDNSESVVTLVTLGTTVHDKATVSGSGPTPTGTVDFMFFTNGSCTGTGTSAGTVTLDASGVAHPSSSEGPLAAGSYSFQAHYNGDSNYNASTSDCEPFTVNKAGSSVVTQIHDGNENAVTSVALGTTVHDKATVSGNANGKIVFQSNRDGNYEIYMMDADGSNQTRLTTNTANDLDPVWSPDGTKIAFSSDRDGNFEIYVMDANGSNQTRVTNNSIDDKAPAWSLDGTKIAFIRTSGPISGDVFVMNSNGSGSAMNLTNFVPGNFPDAFDVTWSPDGTKILLSVSLSNTLQEIYIMNSDGSSLTQLTNNGVLTFAPDWSPDGTKIAFNRSPAGGAAIFVMNPDASGQTSLTNNIDGHADWSPDGTQIVFDSGRDGNGEIYRMNPDGSGQTRLTTNSAQDLNPDWQPLPIASTGTVDFTFYSNNTCNGNGTPAGTVTLDASGVAHPSSSEGPLAAGSYSFQAHYNGDSNYFAADSACEPLTVGKSNTTTATEIHLADESVVNGPVALGSTMHDKATVTDSGAGIPTGTVDFTFFNNLTCEGTSTSAGTVTLDASGVAHPSDEFGPLAAGSYSFRATYNGDNNYNASTSDCEPFTVSKADVALTTTIHNDADDSVVSGPLALGSSVHDHAIFSGQVDSLAINPPDATYKFYTNGTCSGDGTDAGSGTQSATEGPLGAGSYSFKAFYAGNDNYNAFTSDCEPFTISKSNTTTATEIHLADESVVNGPVALGSTMHDKATVTDSGTGIPTGTVDFTFFTNGSCTGTDTSAGTVTLDASGVAHPSSSEGPLAAGSYSFQAHYNGDSNYNASTSDCEPFTVNKADITLLTTIYNAADNSVVTGALPLGSSVYDVASFSGAIPGFTPDITKVTYTFDAAAAGNGAQSDTEGPLGAGNYIFKAFFAGDDNYNPVDSADEPLTINKGDITLLTTIYNAADNTVVTGALPVGSSVYDKASFSGATPGFTPDITKVAYTFNAAAAGSGAQSNTEGPLGAGSYTFKASFAGDDNYNPATSADEPLTINPASPSIATIAGGTVVIGSGDKLTDTAVLSDGFNPTGTITFTLYNSSHVAVYTDAVTVTGNGTYDTSMGTNPGGYLPIATGTYLWTATYSGDSNNNGATDNGENENETANPASPTIVTTASAGGVVGSVTLKDSAILSGGFNPTGTITFTLKAPNSTVVDTETVPVNGNGTYTTLTGYIPTQVGTYTWSATYSGDANNNTATDDGTNETAVVTKASPSISTTPDPVQGAVGVTLNDSASLSGGYNPTGTITFKLYRPSNTTCSGTPDFSQDVTVNGSGTYSTSLGFASDVTGTWHWVAVYSGDSNNNGVSSGCADEPVTVLSHSLITDTSLCTLTNDQFKLVYTPDQTNGWKLNASNPGQFYYNIFYSGAGNEDITVTLPYPWVTQGAMPVHVYDNVTFAKNSSGQTCLTPGNTLAAYPTQVTLADYGAAYDFTNNTKIITVHVPALAGPSSFAYINIHLDYGLKGTTGYAKGGPSGNDAVKVGTSTVLIPDKQTYDFTDSTDGIVTITSINSFKKDPGIGGLVLNKNGDPKAGLQVKIYSGTSAKGTPLATLTTDEDGWYMWQYKWTGKAASFTVYLPAYPTLTQTVTLKANGYLVVSFTVP